MNRHANLFFFICSLVIVALVSRTEHQRPLDPSLLHIRGVYLGELKTEMIRDWGYAGTRDGLESFGGQVTLPTGEKVLYPNLRARFGFQDQAILLKGDQLSYGVGDSSISWQELKQSGRLPKPVVSETSDGEKYAFYKPLGLVVSIYSDERREFVLVDMEWVR